MSLLQARIEELGSAILNFKGNIVYIDGFYNRERLLDYLSGSQCRMSQGLYDYEDLDYSRIQDNCMMIIKQEDKEFKRYQYVPFFKGIVKYINSEKKNASRIFTLRKCLYSQRYNIIISDEKSKKQSIGFTNIQDLKRNFETLYPGYKLYNLDNKKIKEGFDQFREDFNNAYSLFEL